MLKTLKQSHARLSAYRNRRRIYIVPTRLGYSYGVLLLVLLLGAINYSNSLGHLLSFLLASLGWVGMYHCYRNIRMLDLTRIDGEPVFSGQIANLNLHLLHQGNYDSYEIEIAHKTTLQKSWRPFSFLRGYHVLNHVASVKHHQSNRISVAIPTHHRGWFTPGRLRLASTFPLGLFNCWTYFDIQDSRILVYPQPAGKLPLPHSPEGKQPSSITSAELGMDDFNGFNRYRSGEPMHAVAWKALARDNIMRIKQFSSPQSQSVSLSWQSVAALNDIESKLSQLCRWIVQAEAQNLSYSLELPNQRFPSGQGESHCHQCLKALALYENS